MLGAELRAGYKRDDARLTRHDYRKSQTKWQKWAEEGLTGGKAAGIFELRDHVGDRTGADACVSITNFVDRITKLIAIEVNAAITENDRAGILTLLLSADSSVVDADTV